jgi:hypothetical protein
LSPLGCLPNHPTLIRSTGAAIAKASLLHFYDAFSVRKLTKRVHVSVRSKVDEPFAWPCHLVEGRLAKHSWLLILKGQLKDVVSAFDPSPVLLSGTGHTFARAPAWTKSRSDGGAAGRGFHPAIRGHPFALADDASNGYILPFGLCEGRAPKGVRAV